MHADTADYRDIFLRGAPMMDTRAPIEYAKGAFPNTVNLPLMTDAEREKVGTCYKHNGQEAAIALGHRLVTGDTKIQRIAAWADFARAHPDGYLYCFRGGLRSQIVQQWLATEAGIEYPRVAGGYKAMRAYLIDVTERAIDECAFVLLGGLTGTGKTEVLGQLANAIDLEGHANHRGSAFGKQATPQPVQIDFENRLSIDILRQRETGTGQFVLEDESLAVGSCLIPHRLVETMECSPVVWLEDSFEARAHRILHDYVIDLCSQFVALHGEGAGFDLFAERLQQSLTNISKRLGGDRYQRLTLSMQQALDEQKRNGRVETHLVWIEALLADYYDPMYAYQLENKRERIEFRGTRDEVLAWLRERGAH